MLKMQLEGRAILELIPPGQASMTLRPLDAAHCRRKLITNYEAVEETELYNPNNIFILGKDDVAQLPAFLEKPWVNIPDAVLAKYDIDSWRKRFFEKDNP